MPLQLTYLYTLAISSYTVKPKQIILLVRVYKYTLSSCAQ